MSSPLDEQETRRGYFSWGWVLLFCHLILVIVLLPVILVLLIPTPFFGIGSMSILILYGLFAGVSWQLSRKQKLRGTRTDLSRESVLPSEKL